MNVNKIGNANGNKAVSSYKNIKGSKPASSSNVESRLSENDKGKFDKLEFDFSCAVDSAKVGMVNRLAADSDVDSINALKAKYAGDKTPVSIEDVVKNLCS